MKHSKVIGSILLLVGTCIGAGILALPMVSAAAGFFWSIILMLGIWLLMVITAMLVLEVNLTCPSDAHSFGSMAYRTLGRRWQIATWFSVLLLFYALLAAYTAGGGTLLQALFLLVFHWHAPSWFSAILFLCVLSSVVCWSTRAVDYTNRLLISFKGLFLFASIVFLMPHIDWAKIVGASCIHGKYLGVAAPIFLCAFGFHGSIPSLRGYVGNDRKILRLIMIAGATIPLVIYVLWLLGTLGTIPVVGAKNSFMAIKIADSSVGGMIMAISAILHNAWITSAISGFSNISMTTSFLGVALGLFDFLADGCKRPNTRQGRLQTAVLTFLPPLFFALYYPKGFVLALGYAAIFLAFLAVILPAVMAYKLRSQQIALVSNKILGNRFLLISLVVLGMALIILQIFSSLKILPA